MAGIRVSMTALASSAAALPDIALERPKRVLGKNTEEAMVNGCILGTASMVDGMIERLKLEMGLTKLPVITCGTLADRIVPHCKTPIEICPQLTLDGLLRIYRLNAKRRCNKKESESNLS